MNKTIERMVRTACLLLALLFPIFAFGPAKAATLRFANTGDLPMLDPYGRRDLFMLNVLANVYEPLVGRDKKLKLEPMLATEWTQTSPEVWRFKLRQGVKFHDGSPFTADDVVFSFQRVNAGASQLKSSVGRIKSITKIDDFTVDMHTDGPDSILPDEIGQWFIMSRQWAEQNNAIEASNFNQGQENYATRHTNGTGPFMIVERTPGVMTKFASYPGWWGKPEHNLTDVEFRPISNPATGVAALLSGGIDLLLSVPTQDIPRLRSTPGIKVLEAPGFNTIYLGLDQWRDELLTSNIKGKNPLKDVRVRKAFYQAIDENAIKDKVMRGSAAPSALLLPPQFNGFDPALAKRYPFDPVAAKKLLTEAGYPDGFSIGLDCPNDRYVNDKEICEAVTTMLAKVGIKVTLWVQSKATYFAKILAPTMNTDFYMLMWSGSTYDAYDSLAYLAASRAAGGEFNIGGYSNPRVDELVKMIRVENDPAKRRAELSEALRIHKEEIGDIPLHQQDVTSAMRDNVAITQFPDDSVPLRYITVK